MIIIKIDLRKVISFLTLAVFPFIVLYSLFSEPLHSTSGLVTPKDIEKRAFWLKLDKESRNEEIIKKIKHFRISYVYLYIPLFKTVSLEKYRHFIDQVQKECPDTQVYPWIARVVRSPLIFESKRLLYNLRKFIKDFNPPGIHLDFEPPFGSSEFRYLPQYIYFLQAFKGELITKGKKLSIAIFPEMVRRFFQKNPSRKKDLAVLADVVDQFVLMMYDTGIHDKDAFLQHMVSHISFFNRLTENKEKKEIIVGAASYGEHANKKYRWMHKPGIENIKTTVGLLQQYIRKNSKSKHKIRIDGYAIFRCATTEPSEWAQFLKETGNR
jgi:hypothetical protein